MTNDAPLRQEALRLALQYVRESGYPHNTHSMVVGIAEEFYTFLTKATKDPIDTVKEWVKKQEEHARKEEANKVYPWTPSLGNPLANAKVKG